jgi:plasmid stabilization system protein ParE
MEVIFSKYAKQELDDAVHYYEMEFQGLGKQFREEVQKAAKRISDYPEAWSVERGDVRKCFLHKFPYNYDMMVVKIIEEGLQIGGN